YFISFILFSWLNRRSLSIFVADLYAVVQSFAVSVTVIQTLLKPFDRKFKVTPKGILKKGYNFHYRLAAPSIAIALATVLGLTFNLLQIDLVPSFISTHLGTIDRTTVNSLGNFWASYNLFFILLAILSFIDVPQSSPYLDFPLQYPIRVQADGNILSGTTDRISEVGATVKLERSFVPIEALESLPMQLEIIEENLTIPARVFELQMDNEQLILTLQFQPLSLDRERHLIELLFCRPGRWHRQESPGELKSAGLLIQALLKPKFARRTRQSP
ncbi:PilZ domain-containing protein, partial [Oscillatoriales cyanobacterium LEGE 11467]